MDSLGFPQQLPRATGLVEEAVEAQKSRAEAAACEKIIMQAWARLGAAAQGDGQSTLGPKPLKAADVKALVRKGIPAVLRPAAWLQLSGGAALQAAAGEGRYRMLSAQTDGVSDAIIDAIDADARMVGINWRPHKLFTLVRTTEAMTRVLTALMRYAPALGYSRHLCHMVAWCMVVYGGAAQEEAVFWTLAALLTEKLATPTWPAAGGAAAGGAEVVLGGMGGMGGQWAGVCRVQQGVLGALLARKLPRLSARLASARTELAPTTLPWLASCYVSALPPDTLLRVWDCLLCEGPKVGLRVGLALLKSYEATLMACNAPDFMRKMLELRVSRTTGAEQLLAVAFKGLGSLPGSLVNTLRSEVLRAPPPASSLLTMRRSHSPPDGTRPSSSASSSSAGGVTQPSVGSGSGTAAGGRGMRRVESARVAVSSMAPVATALAVAAGRAGASTGAGLGAAGAGAGAGLAARQRQVSGSGARSSVPAATTAEALAAAAHSLGVVGPVAVSAAKAVGAAGASTNSRGAAGGGAAGGWLRRSLTMGPAAPVPAALAAH